MVLAGDFINYGIVLLVIAAASYILAISGFAFGMIFMGAVSSLDLMPMADAAIIATILAMVNTGTALTKGYANVRWREVGISLLFTLPSIAAGLYLLNLLSGSHVDALRLALGVTILVSALMMLKPPRQDTALSGLPSFAVFGILSGVVGGLFSILGPPLVYQFYRQPIPLPVIRDSLFALFFIATASRTVLVAVDSGIESRLLILSAMGIPVVIAFTKIGQRYALHLSDRTIRLVVISLLILSAAVLLIG